MRIAVDYDETFTSDKGLFKLFIKRSIERGHEVKFVTTRQSSLDNFDIEGHANNLGIDIIYCDGKQKSHCWNADIWIDDSPVSIPSYDDLKSMTEGCEGMGDEVVK